jgi:hypothetical protein
VGFCGDVVVREVDVVADGGREVCFVVVYGGWRVIWWVPCGGLGSSKPMGEVTAWGKMLWGR